MSIKNIVFDLNLLKAYLCFNSQDYGILFINKKIFWKFPTKNFEEKHLFVLIDKIFSSTFKLIHITVSCLAQKQNGQVFCYWHFILSSILLFDIFNPLVLWKKKKYLRRTTNYCVKRWWTKQSKVNIIIYIIHNMYVFCNVRAWAWAQALITRPEDKGIFSLNLCFLVLLLPILMLLMFVVDGLSVICCILYVINLYICICILFVYLYISNSICCWLWNLGQRSAY